MSLAQAEHPQPPPLPPQSGPDDGGAPARRAVIRWALRLFRREWRQQLLVLALLTVAVAATVVGGSIATNTPRPADTGFGTADYLVTLPGSDPNLATGIAAIKARFGTVDLIENADLATGLAGGAQLRAQDPGGAFGRPMLQLLSGTFPSGSDQVAMTQQLAKTLDVHLGQVWTHDGVALRLVGLVENPQNLMDEFALVAPGQLGGASASPASGAGRFGPLGSVTVLFDASAAGVAHSPSRTTLYPSPRCVAVGLIRR